MLGSCRSLPWPFVQMYVPTQVPAPHRMCCMCMHNWCSHSYNQQFRIHYKQHTSQSKTVQNHRRQMPCLRATWHCALELQPQSCKLGEETRTTGYVQRRSSLYHTLNNREPRHGYDTSGYSIHIVWLYLQLATMTKWLYNCTHNVAISYTFNFTIASTYVHAHLFVCWIRQCRTLRCRRLAQETVGTESQGRSNRPVPYQTETPNRGQRSGQSTVEVSKHCHYMSLHLSVTVAYSHMHRSAPDLKCTLSLWVTS